MTKFGMLVLLGLLLSTGVPQAAGVEGSAHVQTTTADGVTIHGELYESGLDAEAPLVLLFHQAGSSGRGEYSEIAAWLNSLGLRALAWDLRSGGDLHGQPNRTVEAMPDDVPDGFCDAYRDLQAALEHVLTKGIAQRPIIWGSSYSAALVFRLAAENAKDISGLLAFSPASGGPMTSCRARLWLSELTTRAAVFRPSSEMKRQSSVDQRDILTAAGVGFLVIDNGVHGSSMLLDARTGHDMTAARASVARWLRELESVGSDRLDD